METTLNRIQNNLHLRQSKVYGYLYDINRQEQIHTFNDISINDIEDWFNSILIKYDFLNVNQIINLQSFFVCLKRILNTIDPEKLRIENSLIERTDLVLWRESNLGISKLIFDEFGQIVYIFSGNDGKKIKGIFDNKVDMEKLLYRFIS